MPKSTRRRASHGTTDEKIRYHLEELSVHIGAIRQLDPPPDELKLLNQFGRNLKTLYHRHGGLRH